MTGAPGLCPVQPHGETKCRQMLRASGPSTGLAVVWFSALAGVGRGWGELTVETEPPRFVPCASEEGAATWTHSPEAPSAGQSPGEQDARSCQQSTCMGSLSQQGLLTRTRTAGEKGAETGYSQSSLTHSKNKHISYFFLGKLSFRFDTLGLRTSNRVPLVHRGAFHWLTVLPCSPASGSATCVQVCVCASMCVSVCKRVCVCARTSTCPTSPHRHGVLFGLTSFSWCGC